ncbi:MAG: MarR family transcriptional regulator [Verrucomicrobiota bacterium JB022]|nr:MarR family transcriptional regulator [Verrucomicrobiota bacterium JB022]
MKPTLDLPCLDLYATSRAVIKAYGPLLKDLGLTYPQYLVMISLWQYGTLSVKDLSGLLNLDSGTLSPLLKRLQAAGLVERTRSTVDERGVDISLTDEGRQLEAKSAAVREKIGELFCLPEAEMRQMQATLRAITGRMEASAEK